MRRPGFGVGEEVLDGVRESGGLGRRMRERVRWLFCGSKRRSRSRRSAPWLWIRRRRSGRGKDGRSIFEGRVLITPTWKVEAKPGFNIFRLAEGNGTI